MPQLVRSPLHRWLDAVRLRRSQRLVDSAASRRARIVCIASGKGGTGKSILASNLAVQFAWQSERVCLIDFDVGFANDHLMLGVSPSHDLAHVLDGSAKLDEALVESPDGVHLLSGGVGRYRLANPSRRELEALFLSLEPLESRFDRIVIDHGAGLSYGLLAHLSAAPPLLLVTSCEVTSLSDAYAIYKRAVLANPNIRVGVVMNRAESESGALAAWERFEGVAQRFLGRVPDYAGWVPDDRSVSASVEMRRPVSSIQPNSPAALAILSISQWSGFQESGPPEAFFARARRSLC